MNRGGTDPIPSSRAGDRQELDEPPRPRPLLWPAIALMGGIWLSETVGALGDPGRRLVALVPPAAAIAFFLLRYQRPAYGRAAKLLVIVVACGVGFVRHQAAVHQPSHHVAHVLADGPILTRLVGEVVSTPLSRPPERHNPFLPHDPPGRTRFVVALREFRTTDPPTPVTGRIRVSVADEEIAGQPQMVRQDAACRLPMVRQDAPHRLRLGDRVELTGTLYRPRGPQNLGEVDWARWSYLQRIDASMALDGPQYLRRLGHGDSWLRRVVATVRGAAQNLLLEPFATVGPDQRLEAGATPGAGVPCEGARLLDTMVLGQRGAASRELNEAFLRAGGMHFLAVSGFHVGVLAVATYWLTRRLLRRSSAVSALVTLPVIIAYALVAEPNAPILRAATMAVLGALALLSRRPLCALNWLAVAAICILAYNPLELFRPGFQLSLVLVIALFTVVPLVYRFVVVRRRDDNEPPREASTLLGLVLEKLRRWVAALVIVCVTAWLIALPLVMVHFGRLAPWGWLGTTLLSVPVTITIWLSFLTLVTNLVLPPVGQVLGVALQWATGSVLWIVGVFEHMPAAVVEVSPPPKLLVWVTYAAVVALVALMRSSPTAGRPEGQPAPHARRRWHTALALLIAPALAWGAWCFMPSAGAQADYCFHILAVGNGSATVITTPDGHAAVCDAGTTRNADVGETVARTLRALNIQRLDSVHISHANFDHYSGVATLLEQVPTQRLLHSSYFKEAAESDVGVRRLFELLSAGTETGRGNAATETAHGGDRLFIGEMLVEVLWPPAGLNPAVWKANDRSVVLRLHAGGRTVLLPGDVEREAIRGLLAAERAGDIRLSADVLVAPHHGSVVKRETAALLRAVDPEVIVISSAKPRPRFAALVHDTLGPDCRLLITGEVGAVTIRVTPAGQIAVETPFAPRDRKGPRG